MKFTIESGAGLNLVRSYQPGVIHVGDHALSRPFLLSPRTLISDWPVQALANLSLKDLEPALAMSPQLIMFGSERAGPACLARDVRRALLARSLGVEVMDLGAACRTYNVLVTEGRNVVAAFFPSSKKSEEDTGR